MAVDATTNGESKEQALEPDEAPSTIGGKIMQRLHINPNLLMLKVTLFLLYGAVASLLPYLTIHMQSIGLTVEEISIIYLALPFTTFLSPPLTGFLVDKFGQYKPVVVLAFILNAAFHHALLLIPPMETPGEVPPAYIARHPVSGLMEVWWSPCPSRECPNEEELQVVLERCFSHCDLLMSASHHVQPYNDSSEWTGFNATEDPLLMMLAINDTINSGEVNNDDFQFLLDMHPDLADPTENMGIEVESQSNRTLEMFRARFSDRVLWTAGVNVSALEEEDLRCGGVALASNLSGPAIMRMATVCPLQRCSFRTGGPEKCPSQYKETDDKTFYMYFVLRFLGNACMNAGVTMIDPIALTMIKKYGGEFGRERIFSTIGMAIFSPITGFLIDYNSFQLGYTDYSAAFYAHDILLMTAAVSIMAMPIGVKLPNDDLLRDVWRILKMPHVTVFIFFLFLLGNYWGYIESFLFLYLKELGAPNYLLGLTLTVGTLSSMPFLFGAERITKKVGHVNIIIIAFFSHAARLVGYSMIDDPWWSFPFEAMEASAVHLMWVAAATYCTLLAPHNLLASIIGILGMAHFSLGRGFGSFVGGFLISDIGAREAFRMMGYMAAVGGVVYGLLHAFWLRHLVLTDPNKELPVPDAEQPGDLEEQEGLSGASTPRTPRVATPERLSLMIGINPRGSLTDLNISSSDVRGSRSLLRQALQSNASTPSSPARPWKGSFLTPQNARKTPTDSAQSTPLMQRRRTHSTASNGSATKPLSPLARPTSPLVASQTSVGSSTGGKPISPLARENETKNNGDGPNES
ncbi:major facilitator superfamily domain-containing protein 6-like [Neocloeon triangulifer]|uniref:major facilitator superfamily domain-containing protein 6-like n=1 Tax=Neocloeon triangulifer TaxID=2078957 RepID=UPI00286EE63D|nr:major facilitator superfamily domain-containing protein 6-like [Neocloeon triangulifer]